MSMQITVVNVDDKKIWEGAKVRMKATNKIKEVFVVPEDKTISQCAFEGTFDLRKHIDYDFVMLNKHLFELVNED